MGNLGVPSLRFTVQKLLQCKGLRDDLSRNPSVPDALREGMPVPPASAFAGGMANGPPSPFAPSISRIAILGLITGTFPVNVTRIGIESGAKLCQTSEI